MKYDVWRRTSVPPEAADILTQAGFGPLSSHVLCARGCEIPDAAARFLDGAPARDPFSLLDMDAAVARIRQALHDGEHIAIYGDYDVDGMTSIAVLTRYLRSVGGHVTYYVPDRLEEGYGLNIDALRHLYDEGVRLIITVDTGITAIEEARTAQAMGLDLVITDHHQCRETLPDACAVVNPCRPDGHYPFPQLAGVYVTFKLVCALAGPEQYDDLLNRYGDLVSLGTVADVMPLIDENRPLTRVGLARLAHTHHVGLRALMDEAGLANKRITATTLGFGLAPRINAAGRLGKTALAVELLLTDDPARASYLAAELCALNRHRQILETEIFIEAQAMLAEQADSPAIVLAKENWHPGVVGIVASRLAERFPKPVFLICLEENIGKGSARSGGGINLVNALAEASDLLQNYGGHDLAAGFALARENIDMFRARMSDFTARQMTVRTEKILTVDAMVSPSLFTCANVTELQTMEPYGPGHPTPVFVLEDVTLEQVTPVGGGRHVKLALRAQGQPFQGIFFGVDPQMLGCVEDDHVDIAFHAEINTFINRSQVQFQLCDIRLSSPDRDCEAESLALYRRFQANEPLNPSERRALRPDRPQMTAVWRYLLRVSGDTPLTGQAAVLARKIARSAGLPLAVGSFLVVLDVFEEFHLIKRSQIGNQVTLQPVLSPEKADLNTSTTLRTLTLDH